MARGMKFRRRAARKSSQKKADASVIRQVTRRHVVIPEDKDVSN